MSETSERDAALCEFDIRVQPKVDPELTDEEVRRILDRSKKARSWVANTALVLGEVVIANGRKYTVTSAGVTGATEPSWPRTDASKVTSGNATFQESGTSYGFYNVSEAIREGLAAKLAKSAERVDSDDGNETVIFKNLQTLVEDYDAPMLA